MTDDETGESEINLLRSQSMFIEAIVTEGREINADLFIEQLMNIRVWSLARIP